jgi:hypothetical protein
LRQTDEETILVALNFSGMRQRLVLGRTLVGGQRELLLSSTRSYLPELKQGMLALEPFEAMILRVT